VKPYRHKIMGDTLPALMLRTATQGDATWRFDTKERTPSMFNYDKKLFFCLKTHF